MAVLTFNVAAPGGDKHGGKDPWDYVIDNIEEKTNGAYTVEAHYFGDLVGAEDPYDIVPSVAEGRSDLCLQFLSCIPDAYPLLEAMTIPRLDTECTYPSRVAQEYYERNSDVQAAFDDVKVLAVGAMAAYPYGADTLATLDKPVRCLEDFEGLSVNANGRYTVARLEKLGATIYEGPRSHLYERLDKHECDGALIDVAYLKVQGYSKFVRYITMANFSFTPYMLLMNKDAYDSMSDDHRKIVEDISKSYCDMNDKMMSAHTREGVKSCLDAGTLELIELSEGEMARWNAICDTVRDQYAQDMLAKGYDGAAALSLLDELYAKYV